MKLFTDANVFEKLWGTVISIPVKGIHGTEEEASSEPSRFSPTNFVTGCLVVFLAKGWLLIMLLRLLSDKLIDTSNVPKD